MGRHEVRDRDRTRRDREVRNYLPLTNPIRLTETFDHVTSSTCPMDARLRSNSEDVAAHRVEYPVALRFTASCSTLG
jgi:hypothetical protein